MQVITTEPETVDPFLAAHKIPGLPRQFHLGAPLSPFSIRDQMLRACVMVDRLWASHLVQPDRLLIVGAGISGATAAIRAAEKYNIPTTIIDERPEPLSKQLSCTTRWIDPTQYDWPYPHWRDAQTSEFPLPFAAGRPSLFLAKWAERWKGVLQEQKQFLQPAYLVKLAEHPKDRIARQALESNSDIEQLSKIDAEFECLLPLSGKDPFCGPTHSFGAILYCTGYRAERASIGEFSSPDFWSKDSLEEPGLGFPEEDTVRVLVSGDGDGAMQDLLRICTGKTSAREVYDELFSGCPASFSQQVASRAGVAEDFALRSRIWGQSKSHDERCDEYLDDFYRRLTADVFEELGEALRSRIDDYAARLHNVHIEWCYPCQHFSQSYPLNRFLTHLVLSQLGRLDVIRERRGSCVGRVHSEQTGHDCNRDARLCWGKPHKVEFSNSTCHGTDSQVVDEQTYDVILLRHGLQTEEHWIGPFRRHYLPYSLRLIGA